MPIFFEPKIIFYCHKDNEENKNICNEVKSKFTNSPLNDFVFHYTKEDLSSLKEFQIGSEMKKLQRNDFVQIPGGKAENHINYITIILMKSLNNEDAINCLNAIYNTTKLENSNIPLLFICITDNLIGNSNGLDIPPTSFGQILLSGQKSTQQTVSPEEYRDQSVNLAISLSLLNSNSIIEEIFQHNIKTHVSMLAKTVSFPDKTLQDYIDKSLLREIFNFIRNDDREIKFDYEDFGLKDFKEKRERLILTNELKTPEKIKIPFWAGKDKRDKKVLNIYENYLYKRDEFLNSNLQNTKEKLAITKNISIESQFYSRLKKKILESFSIKSIKKGLEDFSKALELKSSGLQFWRFINQLKAPKISGLPFNKYCIIIFSIIVLFIFVMKIINAITKAEVLGENFNLIFLIGLIAYWLLLLLIGYIYIIVKEKRIKNTFYSDSKNSQEFIITNNDNFIASKKNFINKIFKHYIDYYINFLNSVERNISRVAENFDLINNESDELKKTIDDQNTKISKNVLTDTLKKFGNEIFAGLNNTNIFIDKVLEVYHSSDEFNKLKDLIFNQKSEDIGNSLNIDEDLVLYSDNKKINPEKKRILIYPSKRKIIEDKNIKYIESPIGYLRSYLYIGIINEK
jgi:hypothetical protein